MSSKENIKVSEGDAQEVARFLAVTRAVNEDPSLVRRGRWLTVDFIVQIGTTSCFVSVRGGRIESVETKPQIMRRSSFTIQAAPQDWNAFWQPIPKPGWHDIFAMVKTGRATINGDIHLLMCNLQYIKDVLAMPRSEFKGH
jgi:hypothetical protein